MQKIGSIELARSTFCCSRSMNEVKPSCHGVFIVGSVRTYMVIAEMHVLFRRIYWH
jgi:hypothetical protein